MPISLDAARRDAALRAYEINMKSVDDRIAAHKRMTESNYRNSYLSSFPSSSAGRQGECPLTYAAWMETTGYQRQLDALLKEKNNIRRPCCS